MKTKENWRTFQAVCRKRRGALVFPETNAVPAEAKNFCARFDVRSGDPELTLEADGRGSCVFCSFAMNSPRAPGWFLEAVLCGNAEVFACFDEEGAESFFCVRKLPAQKLRFRHFSTRSAGTTGVSRDFELANDFVVSQAVFLREFSRALFALAENAAEYFDEYNARDFFEEAQIFKKMMSAGPPFDSAGTQKPAL